CCWVSGLGHKNHIRPDISTAAIVGFLYDISITPLFGPDSNSAEPIQLPGLPDLNTDDQPCRHPEQAEECLSRCATKRVRRPAAEQFQVMPRTRAGYRKGSARSQGLSIAFPPLFFTSFSVYLVRMHGLRTGLLICRVQPLY